jgi:hypothetical protein
MCDKVEVLGVNIVKGIVQVEGVLQSVVTN